MLVLALALTQLDKGTIVPQLYLQMTVSIQSIYCENKRQGQVCSVKKVDIEGYKVGLGMYTLNRVDIL